MSPSLPEDRARLVYFRIILIDKVSVLQITIILAFWFLFAVSLEFGRFYYRASYPRGSLESFFLLLRQVSSY